MLAALLSARIGGATRPATTDSSHAVLLFDATLDDLSFDFDGMSVITPIGSERFVQDFLAAYVSRLERFLEAVKSIPIHAPPGEPGIQCANLLLRHCAAQRVSHLMRLLPRPVLNDTLVRCDAMVFDAFASINGLGEGEAALVRELIALPAARGGVGLRRLEPLSDAAHLASWMQSATTVAEALGPVAAAVVAFAAACARGRATSRRGIRHRCARALRGNMGGIGVDSAP